MYTSSAANGSLSAKTVGLYLDSYFLQNCCPGPPGPGAIRSV